MPCINDSLEDVLAGMSEEVKQNRSILSVANGFIEQRGNEEIKKLIATIEKIKAFLRLPPIVKRPNSIVTTAQEDMQNTFLLNALPVIGSKLMSSFREHRDKLNFYYRTEFGSFIFAGLFGRRTGKSTGLAHFIRALLLAVPDFTIWVLSKTENQAKIIFKMVKGLLEDVKQRYPDKKIQFKAKIILVTHGNGLVASIEFRACSGDVSDSTSPTRLSLSLGRGVCLAGGGTDAGREGEFRGDGQSKEERVGGGYRCSLLVVFLVGRGLILDGLGRLRRELLAPEEDVAHRREGDVPVQVWRHHQPDHIVVDVVGDHGEGADGGGGAAVQEG